jgi:hypothetical protein
METKKFKSFINERFINAVGDRDIELKKQYGKQVFDLLQKSYASIGGLKSGGFESVDSMIKKIPMWKMVVNKGTVEAVILYKDKGGRKSVAMGSTGSDYARKHIKSILAKDITRSYGEKSKAALGLLMKLVPWSVLEPYVQRPQVVDKISGDDEILTIAEYQKKVSRDLPMDAVKTLEKYPELRPYGYFRELGGSYIFKVMIGSPGKTIK